ncbi:sugar ABC transporter ATP-binding protein [Asticcacaulis sp. AC460]|uniref:ABC transporter ATP-binding protein n=1 Tax=Asticcacaulis sp. AC460 TaxID=1282360 RepID=UPI0003C3BBB2|nr:ABC transporter ATP-binding protein [Asticcacaulis sp. AC460]ESQ88882.1 sugar ABC transporter ATP-binding protein [Asticcacaulis sp. AC460]
MSNIVEINGVELSYPIYSIRAHSLRNTLVNLAIGGKLLKDGQDVIHIQALHNISFTLGEGDRLGVMGHNGAGKSTLLKVIAGIYEPDRGSVNVKGDISCMIDIGLGLDSAHTGRENIFNMGRMRGIGRKEIEASMEAIIEFSELGAFIDLPVQTYSAGMRTRLVFSVATTLKPDVLLLDEWIGAGDASFHEKAANRMNSLLENSRAMVLATHSFGMVQKVCNKLLVLDQGRQIYLGSVADYDPSTLKL